MAKINLKICMGTMCYVMGGAELRAIAEFLPDELKDRVSISYSPCLGVCGRSGEPPYIELNGRIVPGVTKSGLIRILKEELSNVV